MGFEGFKFIENMAMTTTETRYRSWRERLFTRPWQPRRKYVVTQKPMRDLIRVNADTFMGHPATIRHIRSMTPPHD